MFKWITKTRDITELSRQNWSYLKLWRKGYDNLKDDGLTDDTATAKSVMHVIVDGTTTDLHVVYVDRKRGADFEYYRKDGMIESFSLRNGELKEFDEFNVRARYIGFNDVELVFMAPPNVVFKRADAKEWRE